VNLLAPLYRIKNQGMGRSRPGRRTQLPELEELVPQRLLARLIPRNRFLAILIGGLLGLAFPMCDCGIMPIMRRLLRKRLPLSTCTAYMLAGPILNAIVILSTFVAFSGSGTGLPTVGERNVVSPWQMVVLRLSLGYLVAVGASLVVEWQWRRHGNALLTAWVIPPGTENGEEKNNGRRSWWLRIGLISETALRDFVDITAILVLGALLAAFARQALNPDQMAQWGASRPALAIVIMMGLAIILCLCSEADAFIANSFVYAPSAGKLAFMVLGPMLDIKLFLMYRRVFRPRLIWTIISAVVIQVFLYTVLVHYIWNPPTWLGNVSVSPAAAP
jgi:hypothetical protein